MKTIFTLALVASLAILTSSASAQIRVPQESVSLYDHLQAPLESVSMYDHLQIPSVFGLTPNNLRSKTTEAKLVDWATMTDDQILLVLLMVDAGLPLEEAMLFFPDRQASSPISDLPPDQPCGFTGSLVRALRL